MKKKKFKRMKRGRTFIKGLERENEQKMVKRAMKKICTIKTTEEERERGRK